MRRLDKGVEVDLHCEARDGDARLFALHVDGDSRPALVGRWRPGLRVERGLN